MTSHFQHNFNRIARIIHGGEADLVLSETLREENIRDVLLVTSPSMARSAYLKALIAGLPCRDLTVYGACRPHSPARCTIEAVHAMNGRRPDVVLAVGGGSVIDTAKSVCIAFWKNIASEEALSGLLLSSVRLHSGEAEPHPRIIAIPTTLSAAELSPVGGMLNERKSAKETIGHEYAIPRTIIYDPAALAHAPREILLSSGIKAIDHAAETLCALQPNAYTEPLAERALALLGKALPAIADAMDLKKPPPRRLLAEAQLGCWMSVAGPAHGVLVGASHAIGHALGAVCGVSHGLTSCVTLAPVLRWNHVYCPRANRLISSALSGNATGDAASIIEGLVARLSLPSRLSEIGVDRAQFPAVADVAICDRYAASNCRPITSGADIVEILELAA